jgi:2-hydroxychromene-2-carboxylate isomerase
LKKASPQEKSPNISGSLIEIGQDVDRVMGLATSQEIVSMLDKETIEAKALGVFGSPSFVVSGEVFWGDDRLEDAVSWALRGSLAPI